MSKKPFSLLGMIAAMFASTRVDTSFHSELPNPARRKYGKSKGGKHYMADRSQRARAWKKCFGGLAVPKYVA